MIKLVPFVSIYTLYVLYYDSLPRECFRSLITFLNRDLSYFLLL